MKHPYEKFIRMELLALLSVVFFIILTMIKGWVLLVFLSLFFIVISLICDGLALLHTHQKAPAAKQLARGLLVFVLTVYLLLRL
jgi:hypothetical protein